MLPTTPGWTRRFRGHVVELIGAHGTIWFREDLSPIPALPRRGAVPRVERFVTEEGEHGVFVSSPPRLSALILGDRHYERLDGLGEGETFALAFREIARGVTLGLGVRRRRVVYEPPRGWIPVRRDLVTDFIGPATPLGSTLIRVYPAVPSKQTADEIVTGLVAADASVGLGTQTLERMAIPGGVMLATKVTSQDRALWRDWAVFRRGPYVMSARLEGTGEKAVNASRDAFTRLVQSIEPPPTVDVPPIPTPIPLPWVD